MQTTFHILVENTGNQGLVGDTFRQGFFLECPQIPGREPDVYTGVFPEHRFRVFLMALLSFSEIRNLSEFTGFKRLQKFLFFLIQSVH